jgi:hypothetical protein
MTNGDGSSGTDIVGGVEQEVRAVYISACTGRDVSSVAATPS